MPSPKAAANASPWYVYLVRRSDGALYTGITTDVKRRLHEHANGKRGARALRARGPLRLAYQTSIGDRALATRAEHRIKRLDRRAKEALVRAQPDSRALLARLGLD